MMSAKESRAADESKVNSEDAESDRPVEEALRSEADEVEEVETNEDDVEIEVEVDPLQLAHQKIVELEKKASANYDRFLRATADLENVRKRSRREISDVRRDESGKVLKDMLPVADNLERAIIHAKDDKADASKSILDGVELVIRQFEQVLARYQVTKVKAMGELFDPAIHEAVSQISSADFAPGSVVDVLQTGYVIENRLLRPSLVVVSTAAATDNNGESPEPNNGDKEIETDEAEASPSGHEGDE